MLMKQKSNKQLLTRFSFCLVICFTKCPGKENCYIVGYSLLFYQLLIFIFRTKTDVKIKNRIKGL